MKDGRAAKPEDEPPPMWFRSYMEKVKCPGGRGDPPGPGLSDRPDPASPSPQFKDEVVKEVVERMCTDFSGQCCTHKASEGPGEASEGPGEAAGGGPPGPRPGPSAPPGSLGVCPSCILCETCRHSHDPSHSLVRTKTPTGRRPFPRRGDRTVRKAERQRLKAERRQLRAEVKEIKKKLRLEKRGLQWSGPPASGPKPAVFSDALYVETRGPGVRLSSGVSSMAALFLDENLPDGTRLQPGAAFVKYWKMRNSGSVGWTAETKLVFMWGNLGLASEERREVAVPPLRPGQVGVVSVALAAPRAEGSYTSHWRLAHRGRQFGPRVWCSVVVDPFRTEDGDPGLLADFQHGDLFFPSDDLLTPQVPQPLYRRSSTLQTGQSESVIMVPPSVPQDLLSFQLLDINIVQELDKVPNNTPADLTPCMSPLPPDRRSRVEGEGPVLSALPVSPSGLKPRAPREATEPPAPDDEREDEISGAQFLCETVIRSLALDQEPDHRPVRRAPRAPRAEAENRQDGSGEASEVTQSSSSSSSEDYIIVLPDCFDTTRPLGESMYSSALSQPDAAAAARPSEEERQESGSQEEALREEPVPPVPPVSPVPPVHGSVSHMLCASQTLDAVTLTPEVVPPPALPRPLLPPPALPTPPDRAPPCRPGEVRRGPASGLVKGALSVAASAYKALFTGPGPGCSDPALMAVLLEMGFRDQRLNQQLLRKHGYSLLHTVNELVQRAEDRDRDRDRDRDHKSQSRTQNPALDALH
uniref:NBR1 autophagy cargo receptor a n=1 Tax=Salarias fasciatus TaxID=181472 RepID=A0A672HVJ4_SALFA